MPESWYASFFFDMPESWYASSMWNKLTVNIIKEVPWCLLVTRIVNQ